MIGLVPLLAQFLIPPDSRSMDVVRQVFEGPAPRNTLSCEIRPLSPRLGFSLLHWSGFNLSVPAAQFPFDGPGVRLAVVMQITPKGGQPIYLGERFAVPKPSEGSAYPKGAAVSYVGGYYAGQGEYRVRLYVGDNGQLACRKDWSIRVKAGKGIPRLENNQISPVGEERWRGFAASLPRNRLTVILEAAPLSPRRHMVRLSSYDRSVLLTSLTTLLDQVKATSASVVAVDPRNRKVIFSTDDFNRKELYRLGRAVAEVNLGVVSVETLRGPGASDFMQTVLSTVQESAAKSEAVVFLGPVWGWYGKLTPKIRELAGALPRPHFFGIAGVPGAPDNLVAQVVRSANGTVRQLVTPDDFAKALEKVASSK